MVCPFSVASASPAVTALAINDAMKNPPLRIVGATATLEGYREQAQHLYQRPGRRFPVNGPTVGENFWAYTDPARPLRRYVSSRRY